MFHLVCEVTDVQTNGKSHSDRYTYLGSYCCIVGHNVKWNVLLEALEAPKGCSQVRNEVARLMLVSWLLCSSAVAPAGLLPSPRKGPLLPPQAMPLPFSKVEKRKRKRRKKEDSAMGPDPKVCCHFCNAYVHGEFSSFAL